MLMRKMAMVFLIILLTSIRLQATNVVGADFLLSEISAKVKALGAGIAGVEGSEASYWNPANIASASSSSIGISHLTSVVGINYSELSLLYSGYQGANWGISGMYMTSYTLDEDPEFYNLLLNVVYASKIKEVLELGIGLKLLHSQLHTASSSGIGIDVGGVCKTPWDFWSIGIMLQNIGWKSVYVEVEEYMPISVGLGNKLEIGLFSKVQKIDITVDVVYSLLFSEEVSVKVGMEYKLKNMLFLRCGYRVSKEFSIKDLSAGLGIKYMGIVLDYAYQPGIELTSNHSVSLKYIFGKKKDS